MKRVKTCALLFLLSAVPALSAEPFNPFDALAAGMSRAEGAKYLETSLGPVTRTISFGGSTFQHQDPNGDLVLIVVDKLKAGQGTAAMVFCRDKLVGFDIPIAAPVAQAIVKEKSWTNELPSAGGMPGVFSMNLQDGSRLTFNQYRSIDVSYPDKSMLSGDFRAYCPIK